jgi:Sigma-54 interaction domain/Bacterial regulatory protein, Fis family
MNRTQPSGGVTVPRVTLGPGAPEGLADFLASAGIEIVPLVRRHHARIYVDFCGARPSGIEIISIQLQATRGPTFLSTADLVTDSWPPVASLVLSVALGLKPVVLTGDGQMITSIKSAIGVAATNVPVVICGETGSGKFNIARLIHHASRCAIPLLSVNCAAFENFELPPVSNAGGQESPRTGLFLDEIGELSEVAQRKLLSLLQSREEVSLAALSCTGSPFRFIAATNRSLPDMVESGALNAELFWRLNVFSVVLPPLRQRRGDVPMLARYLLQRANPRRTFAPAAIELLNDYAFPGNALELENLVTRLAIAPLAVSNQIIEPEDIRRHLVPVNGSDSHASGWKFSREEARREMVLRTISAAGGNRNEAARRLGISQRALQYHITKAGLSRPRKPRNFSDRPAMESPSLFGQPNFEPLLPFADIDSDGWLLKTKGNN